MSNSNSNSESFDLGRLTWAGWLLSLLSLTVFFSYIFGLINTIGNGGDNHNFPEDLI